MRLHLLWVLAMTSHEGSDEVIEEKRIPPWWSDMKMSNGFQQLLKVDLGRFEAWAVCVDFYEEDEDFSEDQIYVRTRYMPPVFCDEVVCHHCAAFHVDDLVLEVASWT